MYGVSLKFAGFGLNTIWLAPYIKEKGRASLRLIIMVYLSKSGSEMDGRVNIISWFGSKIKSGR